MVKKEFYKNKGFRKPNSKRDESSPSNYFECNKPGYIKKDCPIKDKPKKIKKKALYIEPSDSKNEEQDQEANLSLKNSNIYFMANEGEVIFEDYLTLEEIEDMLNLLDITKSSQNLLLKKRSMHHVLQFMKMI